MMKILLFLLIPFLSFSQGWEEIANYSHVVTDIKFGPDLYATKQQGQLLKNGIVIKTFDVQFVNECGLIALEVFSDTSIFAGKIALHISSPDSVQRVILWDSLTDQIDTLVEVSYKNPFSSRHRGGDLVYHEGILYASFGYGADPNDSQDLTNFRGKLLSYPPEILAYGLRNPFRFDIQNDLIYIADVGKDTIEEIDIFYIGEGLTSYGWPCYEGTYEHSDTCDLSFPPVFEYPHNGPQSVIGGVFWNYEYIWTDHYTGLGGKLDSFGTNTDFIIPFPTFVTSMTTFNNELYLSTWGGKIWKFQQSPLSLDSIEEKEEKVEEKFKCLLCPEWYIDVLGRVWNLSPPETMYYDLRRGKWIIKI